MTKEDNLTQEQLDEITELREKKSSTLRAVSPEVENILSKP